MDPIRFSAFHLDGLRLVGWDDSTAAPRHLNLIRIYAQIQRWNRSRSDPNGAGRPVGIGIGSISLSSGFDTNLI